MVIETMASFYEARTTIAADSDSSDAKKTNNGGFEPNSIDLNGENNNICCVINEISVKVSSQSSTKMDEHELSVRSTTEIGDVKNCSSDEHKAIAENNTILAHNKSVHIHVATENIVNHGKTIASSALTNEKHVPSDKSKTNSNAKHSSVNTKTSERSQQPSHHTSKSQPTNCGKFHCLPFAFDCHPQH